MLGKAAGAAVSTITRATVDGTLLARQRRSKGEEDAECAEVRGVVSRECARYRDIDRMRVKRGNEDDLRCETNTMTSK